jgi:pimeloyl-ACP methyl ester carboxylesterase
MPKVTLKNGLNLNYVEYGAGQPLLLLPGLGYWHWCWFKQVPFLAQRFRLIAVDHRGVGGSDLSPTPYGIADMADDAAEVLDLLEIAQAHVLGTSMGGFIAQEFALRHPQKVRGLVLTCTSMGGPDHISGPPEVVALLAPDPNLTPEQNMRRAQPGGAAPGYFDQNPDELEQIISMRLEIPVPPEVAMAQIGAVLAWPGTRARLPRLAEIPTLVVHGDQDRVVPVENGQQLAATIPGAELRIIPGAGHICFIDHASVYNRIVAEFLQGVG